MGHGPAVGSPQIGRAKRVENLYKYLFNYLHPISRAFWVKTPITLIPRKNYAPRNKDERANDMRLNRYNNTGNNYHTTTEQEVAWWFSEHRRPPAVWPPGGWPPAKPLTPNWIRPSEPLLDNTRRQGIWRPPFALAVRTWRRIPRSSCATILSFSQKQSSLPLMGARSFL